ncbi:GAF domain-containing protein [Cystobacter fuscus]|uniref:ATP-binding protein n=1 Tax=Cystobacter fuscus TaxID=43 RepID=UPI002B2F1CB0|nr:GAF domain-containing protein [Cystobacter fuscus]
MSNPPPPNDNAGRDVASQDEPAGTPSSHPGDSPSMEGPAWNPEPLALLEGMFTLSPVPYIIFDAGGHARLNNRAYREMFGAEPPPGYNLFEDPENERTGLAGFVRRAFRGETIQTPTVWYDPNAHRALGVREARRAAISCTFFPLMGAGGGVTHVAIAFKDVTAEWVAREEVEAERDRLRAVVAEKETLGKNLHMLEMLFQRSSIGVVFGLPDSQTLTEANPAFCRMHGYSPDDVEGMTLEELFAPEERARLPALLRQVHEEGHVTWESVHLRQDGSRFPVMIEMTAVRDASGAMLARGVTVQDISEYKRVEAERVAHLQRTSKLQEVTAAFSRALTPAEVARISASAGIELLGARAGGISLLSPDGTELIAVGSVGLGDDPVRQYSRIPMMAKLVPVDAVKTRRPVFCDSEADYLREYPEAARADTFQGGTRTSLPLCVEDRVIGSMGFAYETWRPLSREERELQQALAHLCAQVLERARLHAEQRRAEQRASFLSQVGTALMESLDYEATLTRVARLAVPSIADWCTVTTIQDERSLGRIAAVHKDADKQPLLEQLQRRFSPNHHWDERYLRVLQRGRPCLVDVVEEAALVGVAQDEEHLRLMRALGVSSCIMVPLVIRGRPMGVIALMRSEPEERYGPADLALAEELAGRAAMAIENALLYKEAREAIRARDTFLGIASHELNTPLTSLKLNLQGLRRGLESLLPGVLAETVRVKFPSIQRQVDRLASLVRELLDVSRITEGRLKLEVGEVDLVAVIGEVVTRCAEDAARAGCELRLDVPDSVVGEWDRLRLDQVLQNLLSNALKYGHGQPVTVTVRADAASAMVTVRDNGIGIAAEAQARLFQKFERVASERNYSGFGLGLWIVKQILDAMGGTIQMESAPGRGATFSVVLPRTSPP